MIQWAEQQRGVAEQIGRVGHCVPFLPLGTSRTASARPPWGRFFALTAPLRMHPKVRRDLARFGPPPRANGRTEIRFVSPSRLSRRWPGSANKTQSFDPAAVIAPILNHVPAIAVGIDPLNSHGFCAFDARNERCQRALVIIHWRGNLRHDQKLRQPAPGCTPKTLKATGWRSNSQQNQGDCAGIPVHPTP
jgi:hypothetical protein